jgi:hypothetical protein
MDVKRDIYDPPYEIVPASPGSITIPGDDWAAYVALTVRRVLQTQGGFVRIVCEHSNGSGQWEMFMQSFPVGQPKWRAAQSTTEETTIC